MAQFLDFRELCTKAKAKYTKQLVTVEPAQWKPAPWRHVSSMPDRRACKRHNHNPGSSGSFPASAGTDRGFKLLGS